ncbi:MAG TPA: glycosyltransferase family 4 protein [Stellaceae bacterium]|nr:glycosyltransferase family 4 protein [Stellaceae bacterium]
MKHIRNMPVESFSSFINLLPLRVGRASTAKRQIAMQRNSNERCICIIHPMDLRGSKVGGIETFARDMVAFCPPTWRVLFLGVDGIGDLPLGKITPVEFGGRLVEFMPIIRYSEADQNKAASRLLQSVTFLFFIGLLKYIISIRSLLRGAKANVYLHRVELAPFSILTGRPFVQVVHGDGVPLKPMSSLLSQFRLVYQATEFLVAHTSFRYFAVNAGLVDKMKARFPKLHDKFRLINTWVDPRIFVPTAFPAGDVIELGYVGRLDDFKDPDLMFQTVATLMQRRRQVRLHYIGTGDPTRFPAYASVRDHVVLHGFRNRLEIAQLLSTFHLGVLFSHFEGMPFFALETLSCGRPMVTTDLPQLRPVVQDGFSGRIVPSRSPDDLATAIEEVFSAIQAAKVDPMVVHGMVHDFHPEGQISKLYEAMNAL